MRKTLFTLAAVLTLIASDAFSVGSFADEAPPVRRHAQRVHQAKPVCTGSYCVPRVVCPGGYSCAPLYGAYGPYGGVDYWGAYTLAGWGPRW